MTTDNNAIDFIRESEYCRRLNVLSGKQADVGRCLPMCRTTLRLTTSDGDHVTTK
jgi:hypothetical protein